MGNTSRNFLPITVSLGNSFLVMFSIALFQDKIFRSLSITNIPVFIFSIISSMNFLDSKSSSFNLISFFIAFLNNQERDKKRTRPTEAARSQINLLALSMLLNRETGYL